MFLIKDGAKRNQHQSPDTIQKEKEEEKRKEERQGFPRMNVGRISEMGGGRSWRAQLNVEKW